MLATIPTADEVSTFRDRLAGPGYPTTDSERIDLITALEKLKSAAAAAQARLTAAFDYSQRAEQASRGGRSKDLGKGIASQVALARRDSPVRGGRHLGLAKALVHEMPQTLRALSDGRISEWRATILVRETATLSAEHRAQVDDQLADRLGSLGDRGVEREAKKIAYRLDSGSVLRRMRRAEADRRVTVRPAPDTMTYVTGLLPVAQGVAVHASLARHADTLRASGDRRTRSQIMADTFVERLTGQAIAEAVPVEVDLVMTDRTLLGEDQTPASVVGYGPIPAALGRSLAAGRGDVADQAQVWVRRLYTSPKNGDLIAMDSRRREFPAALRKLLVIRDEFCRTPWCDAPIRHADHVRRAADGGPTSEANGQGLCEACNLVKEAPSWSAAVSRAGPRRVVTTRTPTGHTYVSTAPDPPGTRPRTSELETSFEGLLASA